MLYCINHPEEISKLSKVKAHLTEVKGIMMDNIEKVCAQNSAFFAERI
jgi:vesicle-associated membrane protein 72